MLRSQIQESEAVRQTQAIEHIYTTPDLNRDCPLLMRLSLLNKARYFDSLTLVVEINNELKKVISLSVISHWSSVIGYLSLIYLSSVTGWQITDFNLKN